MWYPWSLYLPTFSSSWLRKVRRMMEEHPGDWRQMGRQFSEEWEKRLGWDHLLSAWEGTRTIVTQNAEAPFAGHFLLETVEELRQVSLTWSPSSEKGRPQVELFICEEFPDSAEVAEVVHCFATTITGEWIEEEGALGPLTYLRRWMVETEGRGQQFKNWKLWLSLARSNARYANLLQLEAPKEILRSMGQLLEEAWQRVWLAYPQLDLTEKVPTRPMSEEQLRWLLQQAGYSQEEVERVWQRLEGPNRLILGEGVWSYTRREAEGGGWQVDFDCTDLRVSAASWAGAFLSWELGLTPLSLTNLHKENDDLQARLMAILDRRVQRDVGRLERYIRRLLSREEELREFFQWLQNFLYG